MKASRQRKCTRSQNRFAVHKEGRMPDRARRPSLRKPQPTSVDPPQAAEDPGRTLRSRPPVAKGAAAH